MRRYLKTLLHRFVWETPDKPWNMFLPFFTLQNLVIGLLFTAGSMLPEIQSSVLFSTLDQYLPSTVGAPLWGSMLILAFVLHLFAMYFRGHGISRWSAMVGFLCWLYAMGIYISVGSVYASVALALPQLFFWAWYYLGSKIYKDKLDSGLLDPVD